MNSNKTLPPTFYNEILNSCPASILTSLVLFLFTGRVRLLFSKGHSCYRERRTGERRRKSVRGCIVDANLSVLAVVIVKKGEQAADYARLLALRTKEAKMKHAEEVKRRRSRSASKSSAGTQ